MEHETNEESKRPFRMWHEQKKKLLPWRCFRHHRNAANGAWIAAKWECKDGESITLIDIRTWRELGTYTRHTHHVSFTKEVNRVKPVEA